MATFNEWITREYPKILSRGESMIPDRSTLTELYCQIKKAVNALIEPRGLGAMTKFIEHGPSLRSGPREWKPRDFTGRNYWKTENFSSFCHQREKAWLVGCYCSQELVNVAFQRWRKLVNFVREYMMITSR